MKYRHWLLIVVGAVAAAIFISRWIAPLEFGDPPTVASAPVLGAEDRIEKDVRKSAAPRMALPPSSVRLAAGEAERLMNPDYAASPHPVERAVARGTILDSRVAREQPSGHWTRIRLVRTDAWPRPVRVVERWQVDRSSQSARSVSREMFMADQLIVRAAAGVSGGAVERQLASFDMRIEKVIGDRLFTVRLPEAGLDAVPAALRILAAHPMIVEYSEPDGIGFGGGNPNDTRFSEQWGHHNTGQSGGTVDADVDAPEFWDIIESAPGIVIAVLDSGLNSAHPDLQNLLWTNPGEIPGDSIDNDGSGKVDDVNGWDFVNNDNNPTDDHGHGSNVTGIIAANRNNGTGIAGMIGGVRILACKILNSNNSGSTSNLIAATTYARLRGVPIMNLSLQNYPFSTSLNNEFTACQSAGILLSICVGNQGVNNDTSPNYPSSYTHANIVAVASHDRNDARWSGSFNPSNYGLTRVDLFAPGRLILSPVLGSSYSNYTGTSQAAPYATAVCAAIKFANPLWSATEIKNCVMNSVVTKPAYSGICVTGGRLNAVDAIAHAFRQLPLQDSDDDEYSNLFEYLAGTLIDNPFSRPAVFSDESGGFVRIGVPRILRPDAHFEITMSTDLVLWSPTGVTDFSTTGTLLGGIPLSGGPKGYLRIEAVPSP